MRYYSPVEESFLAVFIRVWCRSVVSYNVFWLAEGVELEALKLNLLLMFKRITNAQK
jgi:hypothetical protein